MLLQVSVILFGGGVSISRGRRVCPEGGGYDQRMVIGGGGGCLRGGWWVSTPSPHMGTEDANGVFTLAVSGTGTVTGTGTGKNGLYDIMQNISHYTGTGTGEITGKNTNGCYTHFSGPENLPGDEL